MDVDQDKLNEFLHRFVGDLGATMAAGNVMVGDRLGLYRALADKPLSPQELADHTGTAPRYIEEWLRGQAAGGYVEYDADAGTYSLSAEQAFALTDPDGPLYVPGRSSSRSRRCAPRPQITQAFRTGEGIGWHEHDQEVFTGCERFFRPGYLANLLTEWLPALDGVDTKLRGGARVADIGCGLGASTILMAERLPGLDGQGSDYHEGSVVKARTRAADADARGATFEVASAQTFTGGGVRPDHDLRLPARHGRPARRRAAHPRVDDPGRHLDDRRTGRRRQRHRQPQPGRPGLLLRSPRSCACRTPSPSRAATRSGAQAGEQAIRRLAHRRRLLPLPPRHRDPFNIVYEARP